jgi:hypothetical protein
MKNKLWTSDKKEVTFYTSCSFVEANNIFPQRAVILAYGVRHLYLSCVK